MVAGNLGVAYHAAIYESRSSVPQSLVMFLDPPHYTLSMWRVVLRVWRQDYSLASQLYKHLQLDENVNPNKRHHLSLNHCKSSASEINDKNNFCPSRFLNGYIGEMEETMLVG